MREQGIALPEALIVTAIVGLIWAAAASVLSSVPAQAARWEEAAATRQRVRFIEARVGRIVAAAGPIDVDIDGRRVRVPSMWPRRLGATRPGTPAEVSTVAAAFLARRGAHRELTLIDTLPASGGEVSARSGSGCGSAPACGLREGDTLLAVSADGACGLYRIETLEARVRLRGLMQQGAAFFGPGSAIVPIDVDVISFDEAEQTVRQYDGYRSDNVMADTVRGMSIDWPAPAALGDGPFIGSGPLAYDVDQLSVRRVQMTIDLVDAASAGSPRRTVLAWGNWPWR